MHHMDWYNKMSTRQPGKSMSSDLEEQKDPYYDPYDLLASPSPPNSPISSPDHRSSLRDSTFSHTDKEAGQREIGTESSKTSLKKAKWDYSDLDLSDLEVNDEDQILCSTASEQNCIEAYRHDIGPTSTKHVFTVTEEKSRGIKRPRKSTESRNLPRRNLQKCPVMSFILKGKTMKHEFFVIKITRKFVHSMKKALKSRLPEPKGLLTVLKSSEIARERMDKFGSIVGRHQVGLRPFVAPEYMPNSDCKEVRKEKSVFGSFSKGFLAYYMGLCPYIREAFYYFCEVVFTGTPEDLCKAWGVQCCPERNNPNSREPCGPNCRTKWRELKDYTQSSLLQDLDVTPYSPA